MNRAPRLRRIQEWMSLVVQHPRTADVAIRSAKARAHFPAGAVTAGAVVTPNDRMDPADRLQVYNGGYLARLVEVMATDYPAVQRLVGEDRFRELVAAFVQRYPSRHPNLNRFGKEFPGFLARRRSLPHRAFAAELARLECAVSLAFDAPEFEALDLASLSSVPPAKWAGARLSCNPSVHLLACRFPTNVYYQQFLEEQAPRRPRPGRTLLAVYRKDDRVWRMSLLPSMHDLLTALQGGTRLGTALERARKGEDVMRWFREWAADGLFTAVHFGR